MGKAMHMRVFKSVYEDGYHDFCVQIGATGYSHHTSTPKGIAELVKGSVQIFFQEIQNRGTCFIDFRPYHDVEYPGGLAPRRCLPLSESEIQEFWEQFNK